MELYPHTPLFFHAVMLNQTERQIYSSRCCLYYIHQFRFPWHNQQHGAELFRSLQPLRQTAGIPTSVKTQVHYCVCRTGSLQAIKSQFINHYFCFSVVPLMGSIRIQAMPVFYPACVVHLMLVFSFYKIIVHLSIIYLKRQSYIQ